MIKLKIMLIVLGFAITLSADDAYHTYIRSQLAEQFGVTGGEWILPNTETQTNSSIEYANATVSIGPSSGIETFTQVLNIHVPERRINSWDSIVRFHTTAPIEKNDQLLLIFWINNTDDLEPKQDVTFDFEMIGFPNDRPIYLSHAIKPGWRQWLLPITARQDAPAGNARFQIHLGFMQGDIRVAGVVMLNFKDKYTSEQLPHSVHHLEYDGEEADAMWRQQALYKIEKNRTATLTLQIVNQFQEPIEGAQISVDMLRHEFGFGSAISSDLFFKNTHDALIYRQKLENLTGDGRSFNIVTLKNALKWPAWEDDYAWGTREQASQVVQWFAERGVRVRGHNLLWPSWDKMPADMKANAHDAAFLTNRINNHILEEAAFPGLRGNISEWDVLNEIQYHNDVINALGSSQIYADCFSWAEMADSQARLYLNENYIVDGDSLAISPELLKTYLRDLIRVDAPIHGLGIQGHMSEKLTPPEKLLHVFDNFDEFDLDLGITEYDAVGVDENIAADYMRDILIACFSHPRLKNFIMWGFWDGAHWKDDSPLFRQNWSLKPSGRVFLDYVFDKWWTNKTGESDENGRFLTNAYFGDYRISISLNGADYKEDIRFSRQQNNFIVQLQTDQTTINVPDTFQLEQNKPNPFNSVTTLNYLLPTGMDVKINLFDNRGRHIQTLIDQCQAAGRHFIQIDGTTLSSGIYYVQLQSGPLKKIRKILLIK